MPATSRERKRPARGGEDWRDDEEPAFSEEEEQYKVWPTNEDRQPFRQVMDAARPADLMGVETRMAHAYRFFLDGVRPWLAAGPAEERSNAISTALREQVRMIVLDLDNTDEPQAIFETLNAHGTPLLPGGSDQELALVGRSAPEAPAGPALQAALDSVRSRPRFLAGRGRDRPRPPRPHRHLPPELADDALPGNDPGQTPLRPLREAHGDGTRRRRKGATNAASTP